ncbi:MULTISPECIES: DUF2950 family protein [Citrobacter]|uniref:DUF2950 family protein n=1 Tax=Citrobacter TaxID=544 RepID=UPI000E19FFD2|nr:MULTISPECIES: DUF2950 family protein [Citrobacter]MDM2971106.1 DUF2950 domain-containing protein [Citrobacter sp. CK199]MDM2979298.1 DUF2950 domain-containing protein [Citrobacter sp. CK200]SUX68428.1 Protein of uncharacterised function (DUF2950) [Citrobacter koseri]HBC5673230.1 DUF2950 family protein [Citrobacter koseri]HBC8591181.1 DUF2950 family protein [Citrobacter koseri]
MKKILLSTLLLSLPLLSYAQQRFPSPDDAATAFATAVATQNEAQLTALLGDNWRQFLPQEGADPEAVARFNRDWKISHRIVQQGDTAHLNVGRDEWQLPVPMMKDADGWHFDMAAAQDEILTRAIGRNELSAIEAMRAYVDAQYDYWQRKQRFATKLISSKGQQDGLYWPVQPGEISSPLGPAFSPSAPGEGYHGYHFRIIPDSEKNGFALLAWPVIWGKTGVMSFMVNQDDKVYQANLGRETEKNVAKINKFNADAHWQTVE